MKFSMKQRHITALLNIKGNGLCEQTQKIYKILLTVGNANSHYYAIRRQEWKFLISLD